MATWYAVRVELVGLDQNSGDNYQKLHEKMQAAGFHRVFDGDNIRYELPPGQYIRAQDNATAASVRDDAVTASTGLSANGCRVFVARVETNNYAHHGLKQVPRA